MDDLDDLLDEIEKGFSQSEKGRSRKVVRTTENAQRHPEGEQKPTHEWDDSEEDFDDILGIGGDISNGDAGFKMKQKEKVLKEAKCENLKCFPLLLGGSAMPKGLSSSRHKKSCNNMRCTSCDFKVLSFDNQQWHSSVDYLFFRNTVPDKSKLRAKLRRGAGTVAYCCQCSWKTVKEVSPVSLFKELKWVCGKH